MKVDRARTAFVTLAVILFSGCTIFTPVTTETKKYVLNNIPLDLPNEQKHSATLLILVPEATPIYDTTQMPYTTHAYQIEYFSQNEWAETPAQMILPLIVETIRNTQYFSEVMSVPHFGRHTFALRTEILELKQDFTSDPATLQFAMRFYLNRETTNQVIATKEVSVREPLRGRPPYAGVVAANVAVEKILRALAKFVIENAR
jgi:cholesterol transport system auxiliary component